MDPWRQWVFVGEVVSQCSFGLVAFDDLRRALDSLKVLAQAAEVEQRPPDPTALNELVRTAATLKREQFEHQQRVWYSVQAFLVAAANVSKFLWPSQSATSRGRVLRACLGVDNRSPLRDRRLRNHVEHFDERLDSWAASTNRRSFVDSRISAVPLASVKTEDQYRGLNPETLTVWYRGDSFELRPVAAALTDLAERGKQELSKLPAGARWGELPS